MQVKICTKCEIEKPINDFHRNEKGCYSNAWIKIHNGEEKCQP